eukprot:scaffold5341_cov72-Cyclotella_meneghiniana.AAC.3
MARFSKEAELLGAMHIGRPMFPFFVGRSLYTGCFSVPYTPSLTVERVRIPLDIVQPETREYAGDGETFVLQFPLVELLAMLGFHSTLFVHIPHDRTSGMGHAGSTTPLEHTLGPEIPGPSFGAMV